MLLLLGAAFTQDKFPFASTRVRVSVQEKGAHEELPLSYDSRFVATECELIRSEISGSGFDKSMGTKLSEHYRYPFSPQEVRELIHRGTTVEAVPHTSEIDIQYWGPDVDLGKPGQGASSLAEIYQTYWKERAQTNLARQVRVMTLGEPKLSEGQARFRKALLAMSIHRMLVSAFFVLGGMFCAALLARDSARLWLLPAFAVLYLCCVGFSYLPSLMASERFVATCLVRMWPPAGILAPSAQAQQTDKVGRLLDQEFELARSEAVFSNAVQTLNQSSSFTARNPEAWRKMSSSERILWLKRSLKVSQMQRTLLF